MNLWSFVYQTLPLKITCFYSFGIDHACCGSSWCTCSFFSGVQKLLCVLHTCTTGTTHLYIVNALLMVHMCSLELAQVLYSAFCEKLLLLSLHTKDSFIGLNVSVSRL